MIVVAALAFVASYIFIALKAFQQLNVVHARYWWILPTSILMAICEVYIVAKIAEIGYSSSLVLAVGIGAGLGAMTSVWLHPKITRRKA